MNDVQKPRTIMEMMRRIEILESENKALHKDMRRTNPASKAASTLRKIRAFVDVSSISNPTIRVINEILNEK